MSTKTKRRSKHNATTRANKKHTALVNKAVRARVNGAPPFEWHRTLIKHASHKRIHEHMEKEGKKLIYVAVVV